MVEVKNVIELLKFVSWIPGTPNYKKTKNNHKALI